MMTLFYMWQSFRKHLIASHQFYVDQADKRLLSQFHNLEQEAHKYAEEWLENAGQHFDPDRHDPSDFYEQAHDEGIEFYQMLEDMQNRTRLSVTAGIFHEWDKQLRNWVVKESTGWGAGKEAKQAIWGVTTKDLIDFLEAFGWEIRSKSYFASLERCRLIVNAYKHGNGGSFQDIKTKHPEFIDTLGSSDSFYLEHADYTALIIKDSHITEFSDAIIEFWKDVPEYIYETSPLYLPRWFEKAYEKDQIARTNKATP